MPWIATSKVGGGRPVARSGRLQKIRPHRFVLEYFLGAEPLDLMGKHEPLVRSAYIKVGDQRATVASRLVVHRGDPDLVGQVAAASPRQLRQHRVQTAT